MDVVSLIHFADRGAFEATCGDKAGFGESPADALTDLTRKLKAPVAPVAPVIVPVLTEAPAAAPNPPEAVAAAPAPVDAPVEAPTPADAPTTDAPTEWPAAG
jgi:hypothetical protein